MSHAINLFGVSEEAIFILNGLKIIGCWILLSLLLYSIFGDRCPTLIKICAFRMKLASEKLNRELAFSLFAYTIVILIAMRYNRMALGGRYGILFFFIARSKIREDLEEKELAGEAQNKQNSQSEDSKDI